jgi:hypothetical protein
MIGPLPTTSGGFNRVFVSIDKFAKVIKIKLVTYPKANKVLNFLDELEHHYGLPHRIIIDLGSNINNHQFLGILQEHWDRRLVCLSRPLDALNKRLHDAANTKRGKWIKELPNALLGLRTQPTKPIEQSPYFLVYGSKSILPTDVLWESPTLEQYDEGILEDSRWVDIDSLEEARCDALVQSTGS